MSHFDAQLGVNFIGKIGLNFTNIIKMIIYPKMAHHLHHYCVNMDGVFYVVRFYKS